MLEVARRDLSPIGRRDYATKAGKEMGLTDDEKAFYDALAANDSAVTAMGDAKLKVDVARDPRAPAN